MGEMREKVVLRSECIVKRKMYFGDEDLEVILVKGRERGGRE